MSLSLSLSNQFSQTAHSTPNMCTLRSLIFKIWILNIGLVKNIKIKMLYRLKFEAQNIGSAFDWSGFILTSLSYTPQINEYFIFGIAQIYI